MSIMEHFVPKTFVVTCYSRFPLSIIHMVLPPMTWFMTLMVGTHRMHVSACRQYHPVIFGQATTLIRGTIPRSGQTLRAENVATSRYGPSGQARGWRDWLLRWPPRVKMERELIAALTPRATTVGTKSPPVILGQAQRRSVEPFRDQCKRWGLWM